MKQLLAVLLCVIFLGCAIGINLTTPENTVESWVRAFNDRDIKGMYLTLSEEYITENGGEEEVKANIKILLENAKKESIKFRLRGVGVITPTQDVSQAGDVYLARIDMEYVLDGEKKVEEVFLNFKFVKEDGKYKIVDYWD
ncbi:MAG: hypothetical protein PVF58_10790 [Candidatus Methanofastidiosia archaeon]|jgi:hypothetical protein